MKNIPLPATVLTLLALAIVVGVLLLPAPIKDSSLEKAPAARSAPNRHSQNFDAYVPADTENSTPSSAEVRNTLPAPDSSIAIDSENPDGKQETLAAIDSAMSTYSEEGIPAIAPYLSHSDPEIRAAAIEAMKQLAVPQAAEVLERAARSAKSQRDRVSMLEAAEFLKLPRLPASEVRKLLMGQPINPPAGDGSVPPMP